MPRLAAPLPRLDLSGCTVRARSGGRPRLRVQPDAVQPRRQSDLRLPHRSRQRRADRAPRVPGGDRRDGNLRRRDRAAGVCRRPAVRSQRRQQYAQRVRRESSDGRPDGDALQPHRAWRWQLGICERPSDRIAGGRRQLFPERRGELRHHAGHGDGGGGQSLRHRRRREPVLDCLQPGRELRLRRRGQRDRHRRLQRGGEHGRPDGAAGIAIQLGQRFPGGVRHRRGGPPVRRACVCPAGASVHDVRRRADRRGGQSVSVGIRSSCSGARHPAPGRVLSGGGPQWQPGRRLPDQRQRLGNHAERGRWIAIPRRRLHDQHARADRAGHASGRGQCQQSQPDGVSREPLDGCPHTPESSAAEHARRLSGFPHGTGHRDAADRR